MVKKIIKLSWIVVTDTKMMFNKPTSERDEECEQ
jgi:hypothetical protein